MLWYILNLPKRKIRRGIAIASALRSDVPLFNLRIWNAHDDKNYGNMSDLVQAVVSDGFPEFEILAREEYAYMQPPLLCQTWNYCRFFRHLQSVDENAIIVHDDVYLRTYNYYTYTYENLHTLVEDVRQYCVSRDIELGMLLLGNRSPKSIKDNVEVIPDIQVACGIHSYQDEAIFITPAGAKKVLARVLERPELVLVNQFSSNVGDREPFEMEGAFTAINSITARYPTDFVGSDTDDWELNYSQQVTRWEEFKRDLDHQGINTRRKLYAKLMGDTNYD